MTTRNFPTSSITNKNMKGIIRYLPNTLQFLKSLQPHDEIIFHFGNPEQFRLMKSGALFASSAAIDGKEVGVDITIQEAERQFRNMGILP